jgi:hypothetical protein
MLSDAEPTAMSNRNSRTYLQSAQPRWDRVPETVKTATVLSLSNKGSLAFLTKTLGSHPRLVSCSRNPKVGVSNPPPATTYKLVGTHWLPLAAA